MLLVARILSPMIVVAVGFTAAGSYSSKVPPTVMPTIHIVTTTTTTAVKPTIELSSDVVTQWQRVAWCETHGNWKMHGPTFSGGLGISNIVWREYGGLEYAIHAGEATMMEQITVARRINDNGYIPDQDGKCKGW